MKPRAPDETIVVAGRPIRESAFERGWKDVQEKDTAILSLIFTAITTTLVGFATDGNAQLIGVGLAAVSTPIFIWLILCLAAPKKQRDEARTEIEERVAFDPVQISLRILRESTLTIADRTISAMEVFCEFEVDLVKGINSLMFLSLIIKRFRLELPNSGTLDENLSGQELFYQEQKIRALWKSRLIDPMYRANVIKEIDRDNPNYHPARKVSMMVMYLSRPTQPFVVINEPGIAVFRHLRSTGGLSIAPPVVEN